ncbi:unnamed protein product, partial [Didymodactylos carnosus]
SEVVKTLIAHEPPALKVLPDFEQWKDFNLELYDIYTTNGAKAAMQKFIHVIIPGSQDGKVMEQGRESRGTLPYFPNTILAEKFGQKTLELPGGHRGYASHAADFAKELIDSLKER